MRDLLGVLIFILGIILGCYLGIWVMFIGGIVQIIEAVKCNPVNAMGIAIGIARVIFSGAVGWIVGVIVCGIGAAIMDK